MGVAVDPKNPVALPWTWWMSWWTLWVSLTSCWTSNTHPCLVDVMVDPVGVTGLHMSLRSYT